MSISPNLWCELQMCHHTVFGAKRMSWVKILDRNIYYQNGKQYIFFTWLCKRTFPWPVLPKNAFNWCIHKRAGLGCGNLVQFRFGLVTPTGAAKVHHLTWFHAGYFLLDWNPADYPCIERYDSTFEVRSFRSNCSNTPPLAKTWNVNTLMRSCTWICRIHHPIRN